MVFDAVHAVHSRCMGARFTPVYSNCVICASRCVFSIRCLCFTLCILNTLSVLHAVYSQYVVCTSRCVFVAEWYIFIVRRIFVEKHYIFLIGKYEMFLYEVRQDK